MLHMELYWNITVHDAKALRIFIRKIFRRMRGLINYGDI